MKTNALPFIDRHSIDIDASPDRIWVALGEVLTHGFGGTGTRWFAGVLGAEHAVVHGAPLSEGSTVVGFRVVESQPEQHLVLSGRHRFSRYSLTFDLDGRKLSGTSHAEFPGLHGSLYKTLVIHTRGHVLAMRRILKMIKRRSESFPKSPLGKDQKKVVPIPVAARVDGGHPGQVGLPRRMGRGREMRARIGVPLVLVMSTLLAGLIGMRAATGQTVLHLVLPADTQKVSELDQDGDGLRLGDRAAARGPLTDADGTKVGAAYGDCVVHRHIKGPETGLWTCSYVLDLGDGDLILRGLDPRGPGAYEMAVLGGTGAYARASGDATFTDTFDEIYNFEKTDIVIRLSQ